MKNQGNKMWVRGLSALLVCALLGLVVDAAGGKLAQPERTEPEEDRFVGFHMVYERMPPSMERYEADPEGCPPEDRTHWVEYGSERLKVEGLGTLDFPREILIGRFNEGDTGQDFLFPGLEGFNCFLAAVDMGGGETRYAGFSGLSGAQISVGGSEESVSGTIYMGPPLGKDGDSWMEEEPEYVWTAYRVFQMADGTVYLDGSGNSYSGGGGMSFSEKADWSETADGKTDSRSFQAEVKVEWIPRLASVTVKEFDGSDRPLAERELTPEELESRPEIRLQAQTQWVLVTQRNGDETLQRTVYDAAQCRGEDGTIHPVAVLDQAGMGRSCSVTLTAGG